MDWRYEESVREKRQLDAFAAKIDAAQEQNAALRGHAESPHYGITTTVNGTELTELTLDTKAMRLPHNRLAEEILKCLRAAEADYAFASMQLLRETLGSTSFVQNVSEKVEGTYPFPKDPSLIASHRDVPEEEDDDDEGWNQPILRS